MDDEAALAAVYPEYDFATLPRRAWAAGMILDYLETLPQADMKRVAMFGYSRDGKMAAIATALDERIAAVIAGSTGVGGLLPWRLSGERGYGEGIETTTRSFPTWFVPRLRFFSGCEDRLPVDGNLLAAMIAPRAALIEYGLNDEVSNSWALEQVYHSALKIYTLLGQPGRLGLLRVPGFHGSNDQEACLDWLDIQFGRSTRTWDNHLLFPWDFDKWRANSKVTVDLTRYPPRASDDRWPAGTMTDGRFLDTLRALRAVYEGTHQGLEAKYMLSYYLNVPFRPGNRHALVRRCQRTAWASTVFSRSRPLRMRSSTLWRCVTRATSCWMMGPSSSKAVA